MQKPMGLMISGMNYTNAREDEFNDWYDLEHIPQRLAIPGFINAERWLGVDDPKISLASYDLDTFDVLKSPPYLAVAGDNLSPWSKRMIGKCERIARIRCRAGDLRAGPPKVATSPRMPGGSLVIAMTHPARGRGRIQRLEPTRSTSPNLRTVPGVLCVRRCLSQNNA